MRFLVLLLALGGLAFGDEPEMRCYDVNLFNKNSCKKLLRRGVVNRKSCSRKKKIFDVNEKGKYVCMKDKNNACIHLSGFEACPETCGDDLRWHFETPSQNCEWAKGDKTKCTKFKDEDGRNGVMACPRACAEFRDCPERPPHIVVVLADDLGTANVGFQRELYKEFMPDYDTPEEKAAGLAETYTPTLDKLAVDEGVVLANHYSFRICSPSRCALQSGRLPVHVNMVNTGIAAFNKDDPFGGAAGIPSGMTCMAELMKQKKYRTHFVGKWDAGTATPERTPSGRGYETFTGFYQHANKYWTKGLAIDSTGELDNCMNELMDFSEYSDEYSGKMRGEKYLTDECKDSTDPDPVCYKEHAFKVRAKEQILKHNMDEPFFLFYSFGLVHTPLEVPQHNMDFVAKKAKERGGEFTTMGRHRYAAMVNYMDNAIDELVKTLKKKGMWDRTLLAFMSDNGGPIYIPGSANNYPLRGGKYTDFEGGVRSTAFMSGGYLPAKLKGTTYRGVVSIADWYATFADIAGLGDVSKDPKTTAANKLMDRKYPDLPRIHHPDSRSIWNNLLEDSNPRADTFHLSEKALIQWPYKLVMGKQFYAAHTHPRFHSCDDIDALSTSGPLFEDMKVMDVKCPVAESEEENDRLLWVTKECEYGCLYNIEDDPTELINLAQHTRYRKMADSMRKDLEERNMNNYTPERGDMDERLCTEGLRRGGIYGPFHDVEGFYTTPPIPDDELDQDVLGLYDFVKENRYTFIELYKFMNFELTRTNGWNGMDWCYANPPPQPPSDQDVDYFVGNMTEFAIDAELPNYKATMEVLLPILKKQFSILFGDED